MAESSINFNFTTQDKKSQDLTLFFDLLCATPLYKTKTKNNYTRFFTIKNKADFISTGEFIPVSCSIVSERMWSTHILSILVVNKPTSVLFPPTVYYKCGQKFYFLYLSKHPIYFYQFINYEWKEDKATIKAVEKFTKELGKNAFTALQLTYIPIPRSFFITDHFYELEPSTFNLKPSTLNLKPSTLNLE